MIISDTKEIIKQIALIDNRKVTPETVAAWHNIIGVLPFDIAQEAVKLAQADPTVKYMEPRHIMGWAKEAAFRLDRQKPQEEVVIETSTQPICREHGKRILECLHCCRKLKPYAGDTPAKVLAYAKANIYAC